MNVLKKLIGISLPALFVLFTGCGSSLVMQDVDFSQPVESVLTPDSNGNVHDPRFALKLNVDPLLELEGVNDVSEIRLIKNRDGFYFITAHGFSNVYVFEPGEGELKVYEQIEFPEPLEQPAFNQRGSHIELIVRNIGQTYNIDQNGVQE